MHPVHRRAASGVWPGARNPRLLLAPVESARRRRHIIFKLARRAAARQALTSTRKSSSESSAPIGLGNPLINASFAGSIVHPSQTVFLCSKSIHRRLFNRAGIWAHTMTAAHGSGDRMNWRVRTRTRPADAQARPHRIPDELAVSDSPYTVALVCTMCDNAASFDSFVCYYLGLGFHRLYFYVDDPNDAVVQMARRYPSDRLRVQVRGDALQCVHHKVPSAPMTRVVDGWLSTGSVRDPFVDDARHRLDVLGGNCSRLGKPAHQCESTSLGHTGQHTVHQTLLPQKVADKKNRVRQLDTPSPLDLL